MENMVILRSYKRSGEQLALFDDWNVAAPRVRYPALQGTQDVSLALARRRGFGEMLLLH